MADCRSLSLGVYAERGDYSRSVKLNISGASESFVAWLSADLLHLIGGGIVGSMPLSRTQQQTADLFQAAGVQEVLSHTHFGIGRERRRKIVVATRAAERPFQRAQTIGRWGAGPAFYGYPP